MLPKFWIAEMRFLNDWACKTQHSATSRHMRFLPSPSVKPKGTTFLFQAWYWSLKSLWGLFSLLQQSQSSDCTLLTTRAMSEQVFNTDPKCDCNLTYYWRGTAAPLSTVEPDGPTDWSVAVFITAHSHPLHFQQPKAPITSQPQKKALTVTEDAG